MRVLMAIAMILAAGVFCGIPIAWAVNAKITIPWAIPFAALLMVGIVAGAWLYAPHS
jgi:hypothetical protein